MHTIVLMGLTMLFTHTIGTLAGFGPSILALPIFLMLEDVYVVRPILTILSFLVTGSVFVSTIRHVNIKLFVPMLVVAFLGLPIGMISYVHLPKYVLLSLVGIFVLILAIRGVLMEWGKLPQLRIPPLLPYLLLFLGGVMHGAFSVSGPLIVSFVVQKLDKKEQIRAHVSGMLTVMSLIVIVQLFFLPTSRDITPPLIDFLPYLWLLPFLFVAIYMGNALQKRFLSQVFRKLVFILLLVSGSNLFITNVLKIVG